LQSAPESVANTSLSGTGTLNRRERYTFSVDWFSFGVVVYEFLMGVSPFRTEKARTFGATMDMKKLEKLSRADRDKILDQALLEMEPDLAGLPNDDVRSLVELLLMKEPARRLGARGHREVMEHPWFSDVNWDVLHNVPPPLRPGKDSINAAAQSEIGYFADTNELKKVQLDDADRAMYEQWDFFDVGAFQEEVVGFLAYEELKVKC
jgi:serine/threonine protein kinase